MGPPVLLPARKKKHKEKQKNYVYWPLDWWKASIVPHDVTVVRCIIFSLLLSFAHSPPHSRFAQPRSRYNMYVEFPDVENARFHKTFWRRFRMPYNSFKELVLLATQSNLFARWKQGKCDGLHQESTPLPLLVFLCALWYLGCGWTFNDLSENTGISKEVIRISYANSSCSAALNFQKVCCYSNKGREDAAHHTEEYRQAGLLGCVGSTDATHILLEEVEYRLQQNHLGFKTSHTARTYNITLNHRRRILVTTSGHPAW